MTRWIILLGLALTAAAPALAAAVGGTDNGRRCFNGYAYTRDGGDYRYTEHHRQQLADNGRIQTWDVTYIGRSGETIATKHMDFSAHPTVPVYTLKIRADGYMEGIRRDRDRWIMVRRKSQDAEIRTEHFDISSPMAADSGFDPLLRSQFQALMNDEAVPFRFAAAGRLSVIDLRARQGKKTTFEGKPAVTLIAELDMIFINYFVDSLELVYDPKTQRLLEYRGVGNMHDANGKVYPVRVRYTREMPEAARAAGAPGAGCGSIDPAAD